MNNNRFGCLSPSAILAAGLTLLVIASYSLFSGSGLFSSGILNAQAGANLGGVRSHTEIGNDCAKCHPAPWDPDTLGDHCILCHTDISSQLADPTSKHGRMMKKTSLTCRDCHTEHHGPIASLTVINPQIFPHDASGYSLTSHRQSMDAKTVTCSDCHAKDYTPFDPTVCSSCHVKIDSSFMADHTQAYGTDCLGCHDGVETISKNFDHSRVTFKLDGKHQGLVCEKCHLNAHTATDFKSLATDCASCHLKDDAHQGRLGKDCGTCHKTTGWKPAEFDHNLASFKLTGFHIGVACEKCHVNNILKGTPSECYSCHKKDDNHNGAFGQDCSVCHSTNSWGSATFDHNLSIFKLTGAHGNVACEKCHINNVFKNTPQECSSCHTDPAFHLGLFKGMVCSTCHNTTAWMPAKFNLAHPEPTNGGEGGSGVTHGGASCRDCHTVTLMAATCTKCHGGNNPGGGN